jgi:hypothetical protein
MAVTLTMMSEWDTGNADNKNRTTTREHQHDMERKARDRSQGSLEVFSGEERADAHPNQEKRTFQRNVYCCFVMNLSLESLGGWQQWVLLFNQQLCGNNLLCH